MKEHFTIFVEGVADERLISQLLEVTFGTPIEKGKIIVTNGWKALISPATERAYINQMQYTSDNGGTNLVIFDADDDFALRQRELLAWKEKNNLDFNLFLLPNNHDTGELEDLLVKIINPENQPVLDCWKRYEDSLSEISLPWRNGEPLTVPAKKTKIYAYLEALLGKSRKQKEAIKENRRDYKNPNHWNLKAEGILALASFLEENLRE